MLIFSKMKKILPNICSNLKYHKQLVCNDAKTFSNRFENFLIKNIIVEDTEVPNAIANPWQFICAKMKENKIKTFFTILALLILLRIIAENS